jgi:hypothetical protein
LTKETSTYASLLREIQEAESALMKTTDPQKLQLSGQISLSDSTSNMTFIGCGKSVYLSLVNGSGAASLLRLSWDGNSLVIHRSQKNPPLIHLVTSFL